MDYGSYYVSPNQSQGWNALNNAIQFKAERGQQDFRNALLQRGSDMEAQRGERAERRLDLQEQRQAGDSEMKLIAVQADMFGKVFEQMEKDPNTHGESVEFLKGLAATEMGKGPFFQKVMSSIEGEYDPRKVRDGINMMNSLRQQVNEKLQGSHQTFYDEKGTPYRKWVNAGEDLVLPPGHRTGDQIKADAAQIRKETPAAGGGPKPTDPNKGKVQAIAQISKIFDTISKPSSKGGFDWEEGDKIPPTHLEQINILRNTAGLGALKEKKGSKWYGGDKYEYVSEGDNEASGSAEGSPDSVDIGSLIERGKKLRSR